MTFNKKTIQTIVSVCVLVSMAIGAVTYFATAEDVDQIAMRLDNKITSDQIIAISQQMWQLEDRYPGQPDCSLWQGQSAERDRQEYRSLELKLEQLKKSQGGK